MTGQAVPGLCHGVTHGGEARNLDKVRDGWIKNGLRPDCPMTCCCPMATQPKTSLDITLLRCAMKTESSLEVDYAGWLYHLVILQFRFFASYLLILLRAYLEASSLLLNLVWIQRLKLLNVFGKEFSHDSS